MPVNLLNIVLDGITPYGPPNCVSISEESKYHVCNTKKIRYIDRKTKLISKQTQSVEVTYHRIQMM